MNDTQIKACPFCGRKGFLTETTSDKTIDHRHTVICAPGCGASGLVGASPEEAVAAWNQRAGESTLASATNSEARPLTLTMEEIRHLAQFCGMVLTDPTAQEKETERETEVVIAPWPTKGVKGDDGMLPTHKHIAYYDEYPEEGCVPLGSPNHE